MPKETAMGATVPVSYRMPKALFERATRYATAVYQPSAVIFRLALAEFLDTHDVPERRASGLSVIFPPVTTPDRGEISPQHVEPTGHLALSPDALSDLPYMEGVTGPRQDTDDRDV
jgi:hypothetical protein